MTGHSGRMSFVDVEASSLFKMSYPIELGWCGLDLEPESVLVRPMPGWGLEDWSSESEKVHGISREKLMDEGLDAKECATRMADELAGRIVFSDAPEHDGRWLMRLFAETGVKPGFGLLEVEGAWGLCSREAVPPRKSESEIIFVVEAVSRLYRHTHRAGDDCLRQAAICRGIVDREWLERRLADGPAV